MAKLYGIFYEDWKNGHVHIAKPTKALISAPVS